MMPEENPLLVSSAAYLSIALRCTLLVALIEIAALYVFEDDVQLVFVLGWLAIFGCTAFRLLRLSAVAVLTSELDLIKLFACIPAVGLGSAVLYGTLMASYAAGASNFTWRVKAAFISNPFAALVVAALAAVVTFIVEQVREIAKPKQ